MSKEESQKLKELTEQVLNETAEIEREQQEQQVESQDARDAQEAVRKKHKMIIIILVVLLAGLLVAAGVVFALSLGGNNGATTDNEETKPSQEVSVVEIPLDDNRVRESFGRYHAWYYDGGTMGPNFGGAYKAEVKGDELYVYVIEAIPYSDYETQRYWMIDRSEWDKTWHTLESREEILAWAERVGMPLEMNPETEEAVTVNKLVMDNREKFTQYKWVFEKSGENYILKSIEI